MEVINSNLLCVCPSLLFLLFLVPWQNFLLQVVPGLLTLSVPSIFSYSTLSSKPFTSSNLFQICGQKICLPSLIFQKVFSHVTTKFHLGQTENKKNVLAIKVWQSSKLVVGFSWLEMMAALMCSASRAITVPYNCIFSCGFWLKNCQKFEGPNYA